MLVVFSVCVATVLLSLGSVAAHSLGGVWNRTYLWFCNDTRYVSSVASAVDQWNAQRGDWPHLSVVNCSFSYDIHVVEIEDPNSTYFGFGVPSPDAGPYTSATIYLNVPRVNETTGQDRIGGIAHEMGHTLGLAHNCSTSIMAGGDWCPYRYNSIKAHDISDLNTYY